jgi:hypothetical protein
MDMIDIIIIMNSRWKVRAIRLDLPLQEWERTILGISSGYWASVPSGAARSLLAALDIP